MRLTESQLEYWRHSRRLTLGLLSAWFVVTFVAGWFARELNAVTILGPLGFYIGAQGALIVYVLIVWVYARRMNELDRRYGVAEPEDD